MASNNYISDKYSLTQLYLFSYEELMKLCYATFYHLFNHWIRTQQGCLAKKLQMLCNFFNPNSVTLQIVSPVTIERKNIFYIENLLLLVVVVFSPWASLDRNQSPVKRPVWLWFATSWASS